MSIVFVIVIRGILRFDRTERKVHAQIEAEERAARGLPPKSRPLTSVAAGTLMPGSYPIEEDAACSSLSRTGPGGSSPFT